MKIQKIGACPILNSRKEPTIEVSIETEKGKFDSSAPSGESKGRYEAKPYSRNLQLDIDFLNRLTSSLTKLKINEFRDLREIEGVVNGKIGANSLFALEASILKALAAEQRQELWEFLSRGKPKKFPFPVGNSIGGGLHGRGVKGKEPDFQEFLIVPKAERFCDNVSLMQKAHEEIGEVLEIKKAKGKLNDEGAWQTFLDNKECLDILNSVRDGLSNEAGCEIEIGIDVAASTFFKSNFYIYENKLQKLNKEQQINYIVKLAKNYDIAYIEDPLEQEDFYGFSELKSKIKTDCLIVGDDLTVTNLIRLKKAIQNKSINALIVKPNQNGSLLKVKEICELCRGQDIKIVVSHRSGETLDTTIADLAVAWKADFLKAGILGREREAKLNRIIQIEKSL